MVDFVGAPDFNGRKKPWVSLGLVITPKSGVMGSYLLVSGRGPLCIASEDS